ncbi:unnamed protein product, partial [Adineta steineri]
RLINFQRSLSKGLRYKWLICDGDSSTYDKVKNLYVEQETSDEDLTVDNDLIVLKVDCINHVKKKEL